MAETADYDLLREDLGVTTASLDDTMAAAIFVEAEAKYSTSADAVFAYARVRALEKLWAKSTEEDIDYTQNEEREDLSKRVANRQKLLVYWQGKLDAVLAGIAVPTGQRAPFFGRASASRKRWYP